MEAFYEFKAYHLYLCLKVDVYQINCTKKVFFLSFTSGCADSEQQPYAIVVYNTLTATRFVYTIGLAYFPAFVDREGFDFFSAPVSNPAMV